MLNEPIITIVVVGLLVVIIMLICFIVFRRPKSNVSKLKKDILDDVMDFVSKKQKSKVIKASKIDRLFNDFKKSDTYAKTVLYLLGNYDVVQDKGGLQQALYCHFIEFRLYMHSVAPDVIDTDIDYCILTLAGFKQSDMHKLMNISSSGIRNIKPRLKKKLPVCLYNSIFKEADDDYVKKDSLGTHKGRAFKNML